MSGLLSIEEAAALLKMTPAQLKTMQERGEIFPVRGGSGVQFKREEVQRFADDQGIVLMGAAAPSDQLSLGEDDDDISLGDDSGGSLGLSGLSGSDNALGGGISDELAAADKSPTSSGLTFESGPANYGDSPSALELAGAEEAPREGSSLHLQAHDLDLAEAAPKPGRASARSEDDDLAIAGSDDFDDDDQSVLSPSDSGVKLNPDDSGLSLEASGLDMAAGGSGDFAMDPSPSGGDASSDIVALDDADPYSQAAATQVKGSRVGDFDLASPAGMEDEDESGSQVIALDESEYADAGDATLLGGGFEPELVDQGGFGGGFGGPGMGGPAPAGVTVVTVPVQEKPYSIWNVLGLMLVLLFMAPGIIFMTDLLLNMWDYDGDYLISQSLVDTIVNALQLGP